MEEDKKIVEEKPAEEKQADEKPAEEKKIFGRVYGITNKIDGKKYVGQTVKKITYRFNEHSRANTPLGEAIRKYGRENFELVELEVCYSFAELNAAEKKWIKDWDCKEPNGYNRTDGGEGLLNPVKDTREKMAAASMGNKNSLGRKHTEDEKRRIRESQIGRVFSEDHRKKIAESKKGVPLSQTTRDNMSKSRKGKKFTQEHKDGIAAARRAYWETITPEQRKQSAEHKAKALASRLANLKKKKVTQENLEAAATSKNFSEKMFS